MTTRYDHILLPCVILALVLLPGLALLFFARGNAIQLWRPFLFLAVAGFLVHGPVLQAISTSWRNLLALSLLFLPIAWAISLPGKTSDYFAGVLLYLMIPYLIICAVFAFRISMATLRPDRL